MILIIFCLGFILLWLSDDEKSNFSQSERTDVKGEKSVTRQELKEKVLQLASHNPTLIPIPYQNIPDYTLRTFSHVAAPNGFAEWKIFADIAHVYQKGDFIHCRQVKVLVLNPPRAPTVITSLEARYLSETEDIEFRGDVLATLPDGFTIRSQLMYYQPSQKKISIPDTEPFTGQGRENKETRTNFSGLGMWSITDEDTLELLKNVHVHQMRLNEKGEPMRADDPAAQSGMARETQIFSDRATLYRSTEHVHFYMDPAYTRQELARKKVRVKQPALDTLSRSADLFYGRLQNKISYLKAKGDIYLKEYGEEGIVREAESQDAEFDSQENRVIMTTYPQLYQNECTITGESITIFPNTKKFEATHSNAICKDQGKLKEKNR